MYWESHAGGQANLMRHHKPFTAGGSATFPGHRFFWTPEEDPDNRLETVIVGNYPNNLYAYDPYTVKGDVYATELNLKQLSKDERKKYDDWQRTLSFSEQYLNFTGRSYLANYLRPPPTHFMWRADYFGQEHWVTTRETHFTKVPPEEDVEPILISGTKRVLKEGDARLLQEHRVPDQTFMNMTLKVISCAPRVFEIQNFLSPAEVAHILQIAGGIELADSSTGDVGPGEINTSPEKLTKTRTSQNSWVPREKSPVIDAIYRRSADLLRMDESLLRHRSDGELPELTTKKSLGESLQLVHYDVTQEVRKGAMEKHVVLGSVGYAKLLILIFFLALFLMLQYTAHHDFGYARIDDSNQGARYSTLLFYLNDDMTGGQTSFPRWVNAESFEALKVKPEAGKAVLFYSQLPDGNLDDVSFI
jgi:prolyl 4-hydroxylase